MIIPIALDLDWIEEEENIADILEQNKKFGFNKFGLAGPGKGWRSKSYPPREHFIYLAEKFKRIKEAVAPYGIECGWWLTTTLNSGPSDEFSRTVGDDGTEKPFASCPADPNFRKRFSEDMATFAKIAKPAFIMTEDDFAIAASAGIYGCFCKHHLAEFEKRTGKAYTREELLEIFDSKTDEGYKLLRKWMDLTKDTMVKICEDIRSAVDVDSPEVPIGYMQAGGVDFDGDCTYVMCKALAGDKHTPFSRVYGAFYFGGPTDNIPKGMNHALYTRQHIKEDFHFLHESDAYPHTRFFASASMMRIVMSLAYSYGFEGSVFQTQQLLDCPNEELMYARMFAKERNRFNALYHAVSGCELEGPQICYDPFWNNADRKNTNRYPYWISVLAKFGIPYTTLSSDVAFWDRTQAEFCDDETIMKALSKGLFLDGDAAKLLYDRGYGKYLGVEVGEDAVKGMQIYDLGEKEIICDKFVTEGKGRTMTSAHMYAKSNGRLLELKITDPKCEAVAEAYTFQKEFISVAMTRFENSLGGRVVIMGQTLENNESQSIFNHRRQRLIQSLLKWCGGDYICVKNEAKVMPVVNRAIDENKSGFKGVVTLVNLSDDDFESLPLYLPDEWKACEKLLIMDEDGNWVDMDYIETDDGIEIGNELRSLSANFIMFR